MLGHRSGIIDVTDTGDFRSWKTQPKTKDEMVAIITKGKPVFEPGEIAISVNWNKRELILPLSNLGYRKNSMKVKIAMFDAASVYVRVN